MTPEETLVFIREYAERQEAFASPAYPQMTEADRRMFLHAAQLLRTVADRLEAKYKEKQI